MTVRTGMQSLVDQVRVLTGAGTAEYTAGTVTYWSDTDLQTALDANSRFVVQSLLMWQPQQIGGTANYFNALLQYRDLEDAPGTSGTSRFVIRDGAGSAVGTANYTLDARAGRVSFGTVNQMGTAYYFTGYSYDVCAAAVEVLRGRLANFNSFYDFSADNQSFSRSQMRQNIRDTIDDLKDCSGSNVVGQTSGDLHVSQFVRTDLNPCGGENEYGYR